MHFVIICYIILQMTELLNDPLHISSSDVWPTVDQRLQVCLQCDANNMRRFYDFNFLLNIFADTCFSPKFVESLTKNQ